MGAKSRGEGLAEEDVPVLRPLALVDENLAVFQVHVGDLDAAQFRDPDAGVEQQPQHQGVLHVLGGVHSLVECPELVGGQDAGQLLRLGSRAKVALLANPAGDIPPVVVGQPCLADITRANWEMRRALGDFAFPFCDPQLGGFSFALVTIFYSDLPLNCVFRGILRNCKPTLPRSGCPILFRPWSREEAEASV